MAEAALARVLVVQGTDLLIRGLLAAPPDVRDLEGSPANALLSTIKVLRRALKGTPPSHAIVVLDAAPHADWDPLARQQHGTMRTVFEAHGFTVETSEDPTRRAADWVQAAVENKDEVTVLGYDKRLTQLVSDRVRFHDAYKNVRYTPEIVRKRFDVGPEHMATWLALVGDRYHLPGVKGIGQKGAVTMLLKAGSLAGALENLDGLEKRTAKALAAAGESLQTELERATLRPTAPQEPLPQWRAPSAQTLNALYESLGFFQFISAVASATSVSICRSVQDARTAVAKPGPHTIWGLTDEPSPVRGGLIGLAIATPNSAIYVPADLVPHLATWLADPAVPKTGHDLKATTVALRRRGLDLRGIRGDTTLASHAVDPSGMAPHELGPLTRSWLERALPEVDGVLGKGMKRKRWRDMPLESCASFAVTHAEAARDLWAAFEAQGVNEALLDEALRLSEVLVGMELAGIGVDVDDLDQTATDFTAAREALEQEIYALAGRSFGINSTKQLGSVLFEELGLTVVARTKTGWSTANHALERIALEHPIVPLVMRWRRLRRLQDSWLTTLKAAVDPDGRVRSTFHPARSFTGRLVNSHPDLGRVPGRTPLMSQIRRCFRARPGCVFLSIDYDQLGLYVLAHLSREPNLLEPLSRQEDIHTATARAILDVEQIGPDERQTGKMVNFASFAGQGPSALALQLGVDIAEAKRLMQRFHERYSTVVHYQDGQLDLARRTGGIVTLAGRPWPIGDLSSRDPQILGYAERLARRATHEASVADVTRRGLVLAAEALVSAELTAQPLLQIHDEILFEVEEAQVAHTMEIAGAAMISAYTLEVPLRVSFKRGPNWADLLPVG